MRKTVKIDTRKKVCTENRKNWMGKVEELFFFLNFFPPGWSSPNPPFFLNNMSCNVERTKSFGSL